jgi:hypothetical protein
MQTPSIGTHTHDNTYEIDHCFCKYVYLCIYLPNQLSDFCGLLYDVVSSYTIWRRIVG